MMIDPIYSIVLSTAFLGSGHCIGMCGPIVAALSLSGQAKGKGILFHLLYNSGRITTYFFIGMVAGWLGSLLNTTAAFSVVSHILLLLTDLCIIAIGLTTAGVFERFSLLNLEFPGAVRAMTKSIVKLRQLPTVFGAYPIGLIMGFLPCGFLYAIALAAAGRGSPIQGGLIMLAFGLGTLPALFLFGSTIHWLTTRVRQEMLRWAGILMVFMGCYNLYQHLRLMDFL